MRGEGDRSAPPSELRDAADRNDTAVDDPPGVPVGRQSETMAVGEVERPPDLGGGPAPGRGPASDPVVEALDALGSSLEESAAEEKALGEQVRELRAERLRGASWRAALAKDDGYGLLTLLGRIVSRLTDGGAVLRRALAAALASEGASTAEIAQRFGVSRQRVFRLLRGKGHT